MLAAWLLRPRGTIRETVAGVGEGLVGAGSAVAGGVVEAGESLFEFGEGIGEAIRPERAVRGNPRSVEYAHALAGQIEGGRTAFAESDRWLLSGLAGDYRTQFQVEGYDYPRIARAWAVIAPYPAAEEQAEPVENPEALTFSDEWSG